MTNTQPSLTVDYIYSEELLIEMPRVSVIIPNYNHARFLEKRIQSVLNQTYQDFEVIYLDDASTDNSHQIFARFAGDKRIRAINNQVNSGSTFKQWNKGMCEANGEYVWIAETDDYADERLLAKLIAKLDEYPTVGVAYCQSWGIDENDNILSSLDWWTADLDEQRWKKDFVNSGKDECSRYLIFKNTLPNASAILIRRSVYEKVGGADETMRIAGDWMMWVKMLLISDIAFIAEPLNYYRWHTNTVRSSTDKNLLGVEEDYQVLSYMLRNLEMTFLKEVINEVCEERAKYWVNRVVDERRRVSLDRNIRIYKIASSIDPKLRQRLIKELLNRLFRVIKRQWPINVS